MVQEAETMREADEKKKQAVTVKNDAETLCYQVEKQLSELKEKMSTSDADELKKKMEDLRLVLGEEIEDPEMVKAKMKDLQEVSWRVTQQAYQQASSEDSSGDDKTKDSKFEEKEEKEKEKK